MVQPKCFVKLSNLLFIVSMCIALPLFAQDFEVSGKVRDVNNESVAFATVFLLQIADTTMVKGTSADENGIFTLLDVPPATYLIQASYIGNTSPLIGLDVFRDTRLGSLIISENIENLDEVVVTSKLPLVERKADRLIFNVENNVVSQGSSWDVLKRTPGVIVSQDELQVRNQSVMVFINDRKVQLSSQEVRDLLENYSGDNIKSIEVINNPPAKYDAEGGPILNIITKRNVSLGYKGNINGTYSQAVFPKYTVGTSQFYKTKKLNVFAAYSFGPRKDLNKVESTTNFIDDTGIFSRWATNFSRITRAKTHTTQLNIDYIFDEQNELSFASNLLLSPNKTHKYRQNTNIRNAQFTLDSVFTTQSDLFEDKNNLSADLTYKHSFKKEGNLQLNGHYTTYDLNRTQEAQSDYYAPDGQFLRDFAFFTDADQVVEIYTAQMDVSASIGSVRYETGLKGSFIDSKSGLGFYTINNGIRTLAPALSDDYRYNEEVYAGYLSMSKDWEKLNLKAGLRGEYTNSSGNSVSLNQINDLGYFELFPTFYLLYTINDSHSLAFNYSRKLDRPRYEDLNPFRNYVNENNFIEGNPNLVPSFSNNFNLNYTLNGEYIFDFYYRDNGKYISTLAFQDNQNFILKDISQNVLGSTSYGFDFNYGKSISDQWYLYTYLSLFHEEESFIAIESNNQNIKNSVNGAYIDLTNYITLSKDGTFKGELGIAYLSGFMEGSYKQKETTNLTLGLRKSFWNKRALLSLQANDLLNKANSLVYSQYLNQDNGYLSRPETQYVRLGFTLNFGNFRLEDNAREIEKNERERLNKE